MSLTSTWIAVALIIMFGYFSIDKIKDAKIEINKKLADEKIRYTREKAKIQLESEIKLLEKKKELGIHGSSPPFK
jgi:hypothetical protein